MMRTIAASISYHLSRTTSFITSWCDTFGDLWFVSIQQEIPILCAGLYPNVAAIEQGITGVALGSLKQSLGPATLAVLFGIMEEEKFAYTLLLSTVVWIMCWFHMTLVLLYMQHAHNPIYYQSSQNNIINELDLGLYMLFPKLRFSSLLSYSFWFKFVQNIFMRDTKEVGIRTLILMTFNFFQNLIFLYQKKEVKIRFV